MDEKYLPAEANAPLRCDADRFSFLIEAEPEFLESMDLEAASSKGAEEDRPKYRPAYLGNKSRFLDWILKATPDVESVVDAFSGSCAVAYMYKSHGMEVSAIDKLEYSYHIARAILENDKVILSDADIDTLISKNSKAKDLVRSHFADQFFRPGVHGVIDEIRANIDDHLDGGFKRDIALFALGKTCITAVGTGNFLMSLEPTLRKYTPTEFKDMFVGNCKKINGLVFEGDCKCKAYHGDTPKILPKLTAQMVYFDPPNFTKGFAHSYDADYHFIEGLMTGWADGRFGTDAPKHHAPTEQEKASIASLFSDCFSAAAKFPHWLLSYPKDAVPEVSELKQLLAVAGRDITVQSKEYKHNVVFNGGGARTYMMTKLLFSCKVSDGKALADRKPEALTNPKPACSLHPNGTPVVGGSMPPDETGTLIARAELDAAAVWEETDNEIRFRVQDPDDFLPESFRTKQLEGIEGVSIIVGKLKPENVPADADPEAMVLQSYRFAKTSWDIERAKTWIDSGYAEWKVWPVLWADAAHKDPPMHLSNISNCHVPMQTVAVETGDKRFKFILTHVGSNKNGDHFMPEELRAAAKSAVGKKVDLSHDQSIRDIVGVILEAKYVEAGDLSRVECVGELFTDDSEASRLAYKLIQKKIVGFVSMECDYQEGECSVCGKKVKSRAEYCVHLKSYKGQEYRGALVYEILHGITFTGVGLLDREGADDRAEIQQVAAIQPGGETMPPKEKKDVTGEDLTALSDEEKIKLIEKLQATIAKMEKEMETMTAKMAAVEAEAKKAARKTKAESLLTKWEAAGRKFEGEASRAAELERLSAMSDDAYAATEQVVSTMSPMPPVQAPAPKPTKASLQADASDKGALPVPDGKGSSLEDRLAAAMREAHGHTDTKED